MTMEFSMPMRIRWDVDFRGRTGRTKRIARRIREAAPLFVELRIDGKEGWSELPAIFAEIGECNPRIEATVRPLPGAETAPRRGYPVDFIWRVEGNEPFQRLLPAGARGISFVPDEDTYAFLSDVIGEFAESDLDALHLPNVNAVRALAEKGYVPVPGPSRLREAAERIPALNVSLGGKKLIVHDFFLWRVLRGIFPGVIGDRVEFAGCQAGSALAYVDWEGNAYPCDSLPVRLGNLQETPFDRIWDSPARKNLLAAIRSVPGPCVACDTLKECASGCRGMAFSRGGALDAPDPACPCRGGGSPPAKS